MKEAPEGFGDFKIGQVIRTVKYAHYHVLPAKEVTVLQGMTDGLNEIVRCHGIETNVEKTKVMRISKKPCPVQILTDQKQLETVEYLTVWVV